MLAKVTRDRIMVELHAELPQYGFAEHKGYCTPVHDAALTEHGPSPVHRYSFVNVRGAWAARPVLVHTEQQLVPETKLRPAGRPTPDEGGLEQ